MANTKHRVAVVFGGRSSEHSISCVSAGNILAAIDRQRWDVIAVGIDSDGAWRLAPDEPDQYRIQNGQLPQVPRIGQRVILAPDPTVGGLATMTGEVIGVDVVFPVLHGYGGEDGSIQGVCELAEVPFVGSGVAASAVCMDKIRTKEALASAGLPIGPYVSVTDQRWQDERDEVLSEVAKLGLPVFVKPARAGSSVGISKVDDADQLVSAIEAAREHDLRVIVEAAVQSARELECGVLDTPDGTKTSVAAEILVSTEHEFYDFTAKYIDGSTKVTVPAELTPDELATVQAAALRAYRALGCAGMARIDMFLGQDGSVVINEPNTIPGFTSASMYPVVWQESGVAYQELIDTLLTNAVSRASRPEVSVS